MSRGTGCVLRALSRGGLGGGAHGWVQLQHLVRTLTLRASASALGGRWVVTPTPRLLCRWSGMVDGRGSLSGSREEAWGGRRRVPPPWGQEVHHKSSHGAPGTPYPAPRGLPEATWPPATWSPRPPGPAPARGAPGDGGHHGQATVTPGGPGVQCRAGGAGRRESERVGVWGAGEEPERGAGRDQRRPERASGNSTTHLVPPSWT